MTRSFGINPQGGGMNPFDEELGETVTVCHFPGVMQEFDKGLIWPRDFCGTLCARDGIKTDPRTPNGQDAFDKKLIVQTRSAPRHISREKGTL